MTTNSNELRESGSKEVDQMDPNNSFLKNFRIYETKSKFYIVGRNKSRTVWRVLKIDRLEPTELIIVEDSTTYSAAQCFNLLRRLHVGNASTGGLKLVAKCYGIIGFIKFLGPYYMLLITKRKQIGKICGHVIYGITKSEMIPIPHPSVQQTDIMFSKNEIRYKKLLCSIDLTKDFFFSFSYNVMRSLQRNMCDAEIGQDLHGKMFVWNEFLTREIRLQLKNTVWTVALVYGFFKQEKLSVSGRDFYLTLISRRSRFYAGTRYLANDVETEQIVFEDLPEGCPVQVSSVVQHRGSIPLFWSQETSLLKAKPKIKVSTNDTSYKATRLHFDNLVTRYGNPIIILNLVKGREANKESRESRLREKFFDATEVINDDLSFENRLRFFHLDLHKLFKSKGPNVLESLSGLTEYSQRTTGFFHSVLKKPNVVPGKDNENRLIKQQKGVLRTNCVDCLDRTNVAQYSYGLASLGYQLNALGLIGRPKIGQDDRLATDLMDLYEMMGDILSLQYGGSRSHCKIFRLRKGQWKPAVHTQDMIRSIHRYGSNAFTDGEKQNAINIFLGYFQPQQGRPALWELNSDQHFNVGRDENARLSLKRSASDGNLTTITDGESSRPEDSTPDIPTSRFTPSMATKQLYTDMQNARIHFYENEDFHNCSDFGFAGWRSPENSYAGDLHERYQHDWSDFGSDGADGYASSAGTSCTAEDLRK
ncbi:hypothetical protein MKX03_034985 [Papaver bracteatum]|nr:hypothetical protein MKX03_034985 [Papaver bracteatum]